MPTKSWKNHPKKLLRKTQIHFFYLTAQTAQTEEFMFENVAYRPTVYRTGVKGVANFVQSLIWLGLPSFRSFMIVMLIDSLHRSKNWFKSFAYKLSKYFKLLKLLACWQADLIFGAFFSFSIRIRELKTVIFTKKSFWNIFLCMYLCPW